MPPVSGIKLELGGKARTLRYTMRALDRLETETGFAWPQVQARMQIGSVRYLVWGIWAGLIHEDPDLSRDKVIDMLDALDDDEAEEVRRAIEAAMSSDAGGDEEEGEGKAPAAG